MFKVAIDLTGQRFGRWTVLKRNGTRQSGKSKTSHSLWTCQCDCGTIKDIISSSLRTGLSTSCGCYKTELATQAKTHGLTRNIGNGNILPAGYHIWLGIKKRCYNINSTEYPNYGGRGIIVCDRWLNSFEDFISDMGPRPSLKHTIDRFPDNDGNYEPNNCRWATMQEQANNKRNNLWIIWEGERRTAADWARYWNINYKTFITKLIRYGII